MIYNRIQFFDRHYIIEKLRHFQITLFYDNRHKLHATSYTFCYDVASVSVLHNIIIILRSIPFRTKFC